MQGDHRREGGTARTIRADHPLTEDHYRLTRGRDSQLQVQRSLHAV